MIPRIAEITESARLIDKGQETDWMGQLKAGFNAMLDRLGGITGKKGVQLAGVTVAELASIDPKAGRMLFCTNESGGAVPVFGDGSVWRRATDRAIAS